MNYTKQQKLVIDYMYRSLKASGYDDVSIAGILGNALTESSLNPDSVSASKTYHGIFLNDKNIRKAVIDKYGDYSLKSQMKYAHDWVTGADWVRKNPYTLTNAGKYKRSGYKNVHEASDAWSHMYERAVITDKDGKVIGYQNDPIRRANAAAMYDYINNSYNGGMKIINTDRGGKKLVVPLSEYENPTEYEPEWKPSRPTRTVYPLNNTVPKPISSWSGADAPNATPRLKDFQEATRDDAYQQWLNQGIDVTSRRSPFKLSLSLPSLDSMMQIESPQRLIENYFAEVLGINNIMPSMPSLFPRFKNGKLPCYEDGSIPGLGTKKNIKPKELKLDGKAEPGLETIGPMEKALIAWIGGRAITSGLSMYNRNRAFNQQKELYKRMRESNEQTRDASRAWKIQDADKAARNPIYSGSDNPLGWLYDTLLRPAINTYDKLNQSPLGIILP